MENTYTIKYARNLDKKDNLGALRKEFYIKDPDLIYLDGNSLGRMPKRVLQNLNAHIQEKWGARLIRAWGEDWMTLSERIGAKIAKLIGAEPDEVIIADSTSVNLFKLAAAALQAQSGRTEIVTDQLNYPSDLYILEGVVKCMGNTHTIKIAKSGDGITVDESSLAREITPRTALVELSATTFKSSFNYDLKKITNLVHKNGAYVLWDLSHTVGATPVDLKGSGADLAIGCTYKYLNGGPGAPAFLYVRKDLQKKLSNPISGWFGHSNQFGFSMEYDPAENIKRFLTGTPPVLSIAAIESGVDLILEVGIEKLREKSVRQSEYFIELYEHFLKPLGVSLRSPRDPKMRGSHVSLGHAEAYRIDQALIKDMHVIPDFRHPDNIRFGISPIFTTYEEIFKAVLAFKKVLENETYKKYSSTREAVT